MGGKVVCLKETTFVAVVSPAYIIFPYTNILTDMWSTDCVKLTDIWSTDGVKLYMLWVHMHSQEYSIK